MKVENYFTNRRGLLDIFLTILIFTLAPTLTSGIVGKYVMTSITKASFLKGHEYEVAQETITYYSGITLVMIYSNLVEPIF